MITRELPEELRRLALAVQHGINTMRLEDGYAASVALDALVARITDLEAQVRLLNLVREELLNSLTAAEARLMQTETEREQWKAHNSEAYELAEARLDAFMAHKAAEIHSDKAVAAEAALAETRQALQDIIDRHERPCGVHEPPLPCDVALAETYAIARRALAATGGDTKEPA